MTFGPYNPCPRFPHGTKWEVTIRGRFASCSWNMETFSDALSYLRTQYGHQEARWVCDFRGWIDGPGGRLDWDAVKSLVVPASV